jgi:hypothetical protein
MEMSKKQQQFTISTPKQYTIIDFGIGCYLDLSTSKNVIFTLPQAR